jgi:hypothetical protein
MSNRAPAQQNSSPAPAKPAPAAAAPSSIAIDDLTRRFEKLEINMSHQLRDKEKEIRHLRHALQQQTQATAAMPQINLFGNATASDSEDDGEIDEQYLGEVMASIYAKHPRDEADPFTLRVPHKRVAVDPNANSPFVPSRRPPMPPPRGVTRMQGVTNTSAGATAAAGTSAAAAAGNAAGTNRYGNSSVYSASKRMPRERTPVDARPYGVPPRTTTIPAVAAPARAAQPSAPSAADSCFDAAKLADDKGKEMASVICKSIKLDGIRESTVVPQAVLTCLAGHLVGDKKMVDQGRDMARQVDNLIKSMSPSSRRPGGALLNMAQPGPMRPQNARPAAALLRHGLLGRSLRPAGQRVSTCKVAASLNGQDLIAVVDTGATTSAVTLDCLRRCSLDHLNAKDMGASYINADGRISAGKGRVFNMTLGLGSFETLISPTVTEALNYDLLIGNDVLSRAKAVIDYDRLKMLLRIDQDTVQELDITLHASDAAPATLCCDEMLLAAEPQCTADSDCDCQSCVAGWQPDPVYTNLFYDYIFEVFSLPPCGPEVPGWKRCVSSDANSSDSHLYEQWMDKRLDRINQLEEELIPRYIPDTVERLSLIQEWHEAAFEDIKSGLTADQILTATVTAARALTQTVTTVTTRVTAVLSTGWMQYIPTACTALSALSQCSLTAMAPHLSTPRQRQRWFRPCLWQLATILSRLRAMPQPRPGLLVPRPLQCLETPGKHPTAQKGSGRRKGMATVSWRKEKCALLAVRNTGMQVTHSQLPAHLTHNQWSSTTVPPRHQPLTSQVLPQRQTIHGARAQPATVGRSCHLPMRAITATPTAILTADTPSSPGVVKLCPHHHLSVASDPMMA